MSPLLMFVLLFAVLAALAWSALELFGTKEDSLGVRLDELQSSALALSGRASRSRGQGPLSLFLYVVAAIPGMDGYLDDTERELAQAGIRNKRSLALYVLFHVSFFALLAGTMLWFQWNQDFTQKITGMVAAVLLGVLLPQQVLHGLVRSYRRKLQEALPDTIDLLGIVLGTGLALDQAMLRVSEEMTYIYPALASELATVVMQVRAGQERSKSFDQLVKRTGIEDIKSLAAMIVQSERFGTSLSQALKVYADALRERRRLRAEAAVAKAGIKMLFPVVLFILPALFVVTLVPGLLSVMADLRQGFGAR
jgi:tight adherence protein C